MTKKEFLERMANAYDMGLINDKSIAIVYRWLDAVMRLEGGQFNYWVDFLEAEKFRTENFAGHKILANDKEGYQAIQLSAILKHPCQKCAVDPQAWHTRFAFCNHKEEKPIAYAKNVRIEKGNLVADVTLTKKGKKLQKELQENANIPTTPVFSDELPPHGINCKCVIIEDKAYCKRHQLRHGQKYSSCLTGGIPSFYIWLKFQKNKDTAIGDIARDIMQDKEFPKKANQSTQLKYLEEHEASDNAIDAFKKAWRHYEEYKKSL